MEELLVHLDNTFIFDHHGHHRWRELMDNNPLRNNDEVGGEGRTGREDPHRQPIGALAFTPSFDDW